MRIDGDVPVSLRWPMRPALAVVVLVLACAPLWSAGRASLHVLSDRILSTDLSTPMGIRWAGNDSVYISRLADGVAEVDLATLAVRRQVIPNPDPHHGFREFDMFAVSPAHMVVSAHWNDVGMRRMGGQYENGDQLRTGRVALVDSLDLSGDGVLLLGMPMWEIEREWAPTGTIAWLGPMRGLFKRDLLQPLLSDVAGTGARSFTMCSSIPLGVARFLSDGSALVVPGVQPGVHLYSATGKPLRSWDSRQLGIDAIDCAGMTDHDNTSLRADNLVRMRFANAHRVVDEILPLPQGPGLVIRYVEGGKVHWLLEILQSGSRVLTYQIPITGELPYVRLSGDVRHGLIVLLVSEHGMDRGRPQVPAHVVLAELPGFASEESK